MRGYGRPGPEFTWYCWWGAMLIANDDVPTEEELRAEDEAIAAASQPEVPPADLAALAEMLRDGRASEAPLHEAAEGDGGPRR